MSAGVRFFEEAGGVPSRRSSSKVVEHLTLMLNAKRSGVMKPPLNSLFQLVGEVLPGQNFELGTDLCWILPVGLAQEV